MLLFQAMLRFRRALLKISKGPYRNKSYLETPRKPFWFMQSQRWGGRLTYRRAPGLPSL